MGKEKSEPLQLNKELLESLIQTHSTREIQRMFGIPSPSTIIYWMKKWGIQTPQSRKHKEYPQIDVDLMIKEAENGMTAQEMNEKYGWCIDSIYNHYRKIGHPETPADRIKNQPLTQQQREVIVGSILGDGSIRPSGIFVLAHGPKQKKYLQWKTDLLAPFMSEVKRRDQFMKKINKNIHGFYSYSCTHPEFLEFEQRFYTKRIKFIPENIELTPFILAIWYMDDGTLNQPGKYATMCSQSFSKRDHESIMGQLYSRFNLRTNLHQEKGGNFYFTFPVADSREFFDLVRPYIIPSMQYKIL